MIQERLTINKQY